jgi:spore coat polysaccharide biosynthesis protein SpsF (cytidylyltransferase family)
MKHCFLIQARLNSSRLPKKVLLPIWNEYKLIDIIIERLWQSKYANRDNTFILTTNSKNDDDFISYCIGKRYSYFRGDESDVFNRYLVFLNSNSNESDYFFRICSDNPFIMPKFIDELIETSISDVQHTDYYSYQDTNGTPSILTHYGFFGELVNVKSFKHAATIIKTDYQHEHVTPIFYNSGLFSNNLITIPQILHNFCLRLTLDTSDDLIVVKKLYAELNTLNFGLTELLEIIQRNSHILLKMKENINNNKKGSPHGK